MVGGSHVLPLLLDTSLAHMIRCAAFLLLLQASHLAGDLGALAKASGAYRAEASHFLPQKSKAFVVPSLTALQCYFSGLTKIWSLL